MCEVAWTEIRVRVGRGVAEAVANFLLELGSSGLEVQEGGGRTTLKGYLRGNIEDQPQRLSRYLQSLEAMGLTDGHEGPELSLLGETDWLSHWRSRFHAFQVGRRLLIRPSWETVAPAPGQQVIVIDPQMAFGTGEHVTTQFCLRALEEAVRKNDLILDVGTGSGILSIAAAKLGAKKVLGLDIDPRAIATARENARVNGVSHRVNFSCSPLDHRVSSKSFHRVVANINSEVLLPLLSELRRVLKSKGYLILSGFLAKEEATLRRGLPESGLRLCRLEHQGDWISVLGQSQGI